MDDSSAASRTAAIELRNGIHDFDCFGKVDAYGIKIPFNIRVAGSVLFLHHSEGFVTSELAFPDLIAAESIVLRKASDRIVNIVVKGRCSVTDSPRALSIWGFFPVV